MPKFIMLSSLTDEGAATIKKNPDRIKEVNKDVEALGGKVIDQYAVLGEYDFVNILEAPADTAVSKVALEIGGRGTLRTMTMSAMRVEEFIKGVAGKRK